MVNGERLDFCRKERSKRYAKMRKRDLKDVKLFEAKAWRERDARVQRLKTLYD